jgi:hypothetical protein
MNIRSKEEFFIVRTDARCIDRKLGALLAGYLLNELPPRKKTVFERHRRDCVACDTATLNASNLAAYFRRYPGELDRLYKVAASV